MVAFPAIVDSPKRLETAVRVWVACLAFQGLWTLTHDGHGNGALFGDENDVSLALNMALPFALSGALFSTTPLWRFFYVASGGICLAGVIASFSRGGFVGLVITWLMVLILSRRRGMILLATILGVLLVRELAPPTYFDEMNTIQNEEDETRRARINMWTASWAAFLDNPIVGVGPGNIRWRMSDYQIYDDKTGRSYAGHQVHSIYFTLLPELGSVGTVLYLGLLLLNLRDLGATVRSFRRGRGRIVEPYARATICALAAFLASGAFISVLYYPHFYYLATISLAIRLIATRDSGPDPPLASPPPTKIGGPLRLPVVGSVVGASPLPQIETIDPAFRLLSSHRRRLVKRAVTSRCPFFCTHRSVSATERQDD